jgi:two-component system response regulator WspF
LERLEVRIGIVNDLALAREVLKRVVLSTPGYQIAWQAEDGAEAVRRTRLDRPDVILMDLIMPVMNGVEATRQIMQSSPCPILVVTVSVAQNFPLVCEALSHGAHAAVNTPALSSDGKIREGDVLLDRLAWLERSRYVQPTVTPLPPGQSTQTGAPTFLTLGASTGGPGALAEILANLPANFPAPIVVIQHIAAEFAPNLVVWLQGRCALPVDIAREGQSPRPGTIVVAATDDHLVLRPGARFATTREPIDYPFRPSVNSFFESLATYWPQPGVAVLLTGMGDDGARGLAALRRTGWMTLAQDQGTSVVYGMPKAAAEMQAASRIVPLSQIPAAILARFNLQPRSGKT